MFIKNKKNILGVDITNGSIKLLELSKRRDKIFIQAMGRSTLSEPIIADGLIINKELAVKEIKNIIEKPLIGKFVSNNCVFALPDAVSFIKLIEVKKTNNKIEDEIRDEIVNHIPFAINDLSFDWQVIKDPLLNMENELVLFSACQKPILESYIDALHEAGLNVLAAEVSSQAICRSLLLEESKKFKGPFEKNYAIIDIGMKKTNMVVYSHNTILFSLSIPISGEEITQKISKTLQIETDQAEKAKIICGLDETKADGIIMNILSDIINDLKNRIIENISYYNDHFGNRGPISSILLCGGGANIKNIDKLIKELTGIETGIGNVFTNCEGVTDKDLNKMNETHQLDPSKENKGTLKISKKQNEKFITTQNSSGSLATAAGLSLRELFLNEY
jgi:type IV pilus assembly protein PilM